MFGRPVGGGGENVTPEVTAQTPMISQILSNLGFTADSASGTNKQKLQTNNANLAKISDYLPHGAYVWKKSIYIDNKDITINVLTTSAPSTMKAVSSDYDLSQADESFFAGYVGILNDNGTNTRLTFKDGGVLLIEWGTNFSSSSNNTYSYNPSTQVITISSAWSTTPSGTFSKDDETEFIEFVVSDISTAYPDSGAQDGYWYEKVVEGINIDEYENFKTETVTLASQSTDLPHTYGEVPDLVIIEADPTLIAKDTTAEKGFVFAIRGAGMKYKATPTGAEKTIFNSVGVRKYYYSSAHYLDVVATNDISVYADKISLFSSFGETFKNYFKDGLEYKITMAKAKVYSL